MACVELFELKLGVCDPADTTARADFERFGWMSPINKAAILAFWEDLSPGLFDEISE